jgi:hypothetical protein
MKLATFTRDMAPFKAGDSRVVPDDVGDRLESDGSATLGQFPPADVASPLRDGAPLPPIPPHRPGRRYPNRMK